MLSCSYQFIQKKLHGLYFQHVPALIATKNTLGHGDGFTFLVIRNPLKHQTGKRGLHHVQDFPFRFVQQAERTVQVSPGQFDSSLRKAQATRPMG